MERQLSVDQILGSGPLRSALRDFLVLEHSQENLDFLDDLQRYKALEHHAASMLEFALRLFDRYFDGDSLTAVNISHSMLRSIQLTHATKKFTINTFDAAAEEVKKLIQATLPRFEMSAFFQKVKHEAEKWLEMYSNVSDTASRAHPPSTLEGILELPQFCLALRDHTVRDFNNENVEFLIALRDHLATVTGVGSTDRNEMLLKRQAKMLFEEYLNPNSPRAVNVAGDTVQQIRVLLDNNQIDKDTFRSAKDEVQALLRSSVIPAFLQSPEYQKLAETYICDWKRRQEEQQREARQLSLEAIISDAQCSAVFREHLQSELCQENLDFLLELTKFKFKASKVKPPKNGAKPDYATLRRVATSIFRQYLDPDTADSSTLVNVGEQTSQMIRSALGSDGFDPATVFTAAYSTVLTLLKPAYLRFLETDDYKELERDCLLDLSSDSEPVTDEDEAADNDDDGGYSLEDILAVPYYTSALQDFCHNDPKVQFLLLVNQYRRRFGSAGSRARAMAIVTEFVAVNSPKCLSFNESTRRRILEAVRDKVHTPGMFDKAYQLALKWSKPLSLRFVDSSVFKRLCASTVHAAPTSAASCGGLTSSALKLEDILPVDHYRRHFKTFLEARHSQESLSFLEAVRAFKHAATAGTASQQQLDSTAKAVVSTFVDPMSPRAVLLDSITRTHTYSAVERCGVLANVFDRAYRAVFASLRDTSYPEFCHSQSYLHMLLSHNSGAGHPSTWGVFTPPSTPTVPTASHTYHTSNPTHNNLSSPTSPVPHLGSKLVSVPSLNSSTLPLDATTAEAAEAAEAAVATATAEEMQIVHTSVQRYNAM